MIILDREVKFTKILFYMIVTLLLYFCLFYVIDFIGEYQPDYTTIPFLSIVPLYIISLALRGTRFTLIINAMSRDPTEENVREHRLDTAILGVFMAWGLNSFVPARLGEVSRLYVANKRDKIDQKRTIDAIILEKFFDITTITILTLLFLGVVLLNYSVPPIIRENAVAIIVVFILSIIGFIVLLNLNHFLPFVRKLPLIGTFVSSILKVLHENSTALISQKKRLILVIGSSLGIWMLDTMTFVLVVANFHSVPFEIRFLSGIIGFLAFILPILPNAVGQFETIVGLIFTAYGYDFELGFRSALIDHFVKTLTAISLLLMSTIYLSFTQYFSNKQDYEENS